MTKEKKKILILGGGFGGLYTYLSLCKYFSCNEIDVTIVNRTNYFLFTPLLHEVATGSIAHHQVVESIRQVIYKTKAKLHVAEIEFIDQEKQIVKTNLSELQYDILVVALGATTNFFNAVGAEENSFVLKDLRDAIRLRTMLIESFEKASEMKDEEDRKKELSFAVVGGGATGVELVSEIAELFADTFTKYYRNLINISDISLYLINSGPELLKPFDPKLRKNAFDVLSGIGVKVMLNTQVKEVNKNGIIVGDGSLLRINHVVWTAGVKPNLPNFMSHINLDPNGRLIVNTSMQIPEYPNVFVIGDMASVKDAEGKPLPMLAQVATRQGELTGYNIKRFIRGKKLKSFKYKSQGELASLGQWQAVANIRGFKFSGPLAWFLWRTIYLFKFISFSKKFKIVMDWTINIFYPRDITKA